MGQIDNEYYYQPKGAASYFGLKVMGNAFVFIYGGIFKGDDGAFITGITKSGETDYTVGTAYLYVYSASFSSTYDCFNVYNGATAVFGAYKSGEAPDGFNYVNAITMETDESDVASIATNGLTGANSTVYIYYGTYSQIWYDNATITLYNVGNTGILSLPDNWNLGGSGTVETNNYSGSQVFYSA